MKLFFGGMFVFFMLSLSSEAFEVGAVSISGNGCEKYSRVMERPTDGSNFQFPLKLTMAKSESKAFERKTCMLSLPVKISPKQKIQILDIVQEVTAKVSGATKIKLSLAVTAVGVSGVQPLEFEVKASGTHEKKLRQDGVVFETACGKDAILRANLSAFAQGAGTASVSTSELKFSLKTIPCS